MNLGFLTLAGAQYDRSVSWLAISACLSWPAPTSQAKTSKMPNVTAKMTAASCSTPPRTSRFLLFELGIAEFDTVIGFVFVVFLAKWSFDRYRAELQGNNDDGRQKYFLRKARRPEIPWKRRKSRCTFRGTRLCQAEPAPQG